MTERKQVDQSPSKARVQITSHDHEHQEKYSLYLRISSRSTTDLSSLIRMVVREGNCSVGVLWAVTRPG